MSELCNIIGTIINTGFCECTKWSFQPGGVKERNYVWGWALKTKKCTFFAK